MVALYTIRGHREGQELSSCPPSKVFLPFPTRQPASSEMRFLPRAVEQQGSTSRRQHNGGNQSNRLFMTCRGLESIEMVSIIKLIAKSGLIRRGKAVFREVPGKAFLFRVFSPCDGFRILPRASSWVRETDRLEACPTRKGGRGTPSTSSVSATRAPAAGGFFDPCHTHDQGG